MCYFGSSEMKKIAIIFSALLAAACASNKEAKTEPAETSAAVPCSYSCQQNGTAPCPYVENKQKPRVTVIMPKKRPCCNDEEADTSGLIPDAPEIYVIAANRTLRSMLSDKLPLPENAKIFVADTINNEPDMPTGIKEGTSALKRGLEASKKFQIVNDRSNADYVLSGEVSWYDTATKTVPAIKYSLGLFNNHGQKLGEWNEILHQANGDRSWW
jgi:hypothetical protein